MRKIIVILGLCVVWACGLERFVPLVLESKQSKVDSSSAKPQATLPPLSKTPQVRLWDLSGQYVEQFSPAIAHLRKLATTQEQKDFIKAYEVFSAWLCCALPQSMCVIMVV